MIIGRLLDQERRRRDIVGDARRGRRRHQRRRHSRLHHRQARVLAPGELHRSGSPRPAGAVLVQDRAQPEGAGRRRVRARADSQPLGRRGAVHRRRSRTRTAGSTSSRRPIAAPSSSSAPGRRRAAGRSGRRAVVTRRRFQVGRDKEPTTMLKHTVAVLFAVLSASTHVSVLRQNPGRRLRNREGGDRDEVDTVHAPVTAANFLKYVDGGFYEAAASIARFAPTTRSARRRNPGHSVPDRHGAAARAVSADPARAHQRHGPEARRRRGLDGAQRTRHRDGVVLHRHRRSTGDGFGGRRNPDGQGFAVFGRVVRGMDVVRAIQASPTGPRDPMGPSHSRRQSKFSGLTDASKPADGSTRPHRLAFALHPLLAGDLTLAG